MRPDRPMELLWSLGSTSLRAKNESPIVITGKAYLDEVCEEMGFDLDFPFEGGDFVANERELLRITGDLNRILFFRESLLPAFSEMLGIATALYRMKEVCKRINPSILLIVRSPDAVFANTGLLQQAIEDTGCIYWPSTICDGIVHMEVWKEMGHIDKTIDLYRRSLIPNLKILVECNNLSDAINAMKSGAEGIVLKGVRAEIATDIARGLRERFKKSYIEYCGSLDSSNIEGFAHAGLDALGIMELSKLRSPVSLDLAFLPNQEGSEQDESSS